MRTTISVLAVLLLAGSAASTDIETTAEKLEARLMAPCCMTNTVAVHESGISHRMRDEIRDMLAAGRTEREILDFYVAQHGEQILAMPQARGFSLTPYLFPVVFLVVGAVALGLVMRRWRHQAPAADSSNATDHRVAVAGPYAERLRKELEKLDS